MKSLTHTFVDNTPTPSPRPSNKGKEIKQRKKSNGHSSGIAFKFFLLKKDHILNWVGYNNSWYVSNLDQQIQQTKFVKQHNSTCEEQILHTRSYCLPNILHTWISRLDPINIMPTKLLLFAYYTINIMPVCLLYYKYHAYYTDKSIEVHLFSYYIIYIYEYL